MALDIHFTGGLVLSVADELHIHPEPIEDVLEELLSRGVDEVLVLPLFISLGDHLKNDIPPKIHLVDGVNDDTYDYNGKKVRICYLSPIGDDPRLTDLFAEKVKKYL